jgi:hypothetical protein
MPKITIPLVVISAGNWQNFRNSIQGFENVGEYVASDLAIRGVRGNNFTPQGSDQQTIGTKLERFIRLAAEVVLMGITRFLSRIALKELPHDSAQT